MRFTLDSALLARLREVRAQYATDDVIEEHDAFLLDPGLGPALYLCPDGRVLVDLRWWNDGPVREATDDQAIAAIVVGARKTGPLKLLCPRCGGRAWVLD